MVQPLESAEELIRKRAPGIAERIRQAADAARGNEAQFRGNLARDRTFESFADGLGLMLQPREEYTLINGRADAVYHRFVIEYESPGSLTERDSQRNRHAVGQVKQNIEGLVKVERHKPERLAGVATDGYYFIFGRFRGGVWHSDAPVPVTADSTARLLASLYLLSTEKALTADNLVRDFGENSNVARIAVSALYKALSNSQNPKVGVIYEQWRQQFSEVCGYEEGSPRLDVRTFARQYGIQDPNPNAFKLFLAIHTYYAAFIKVLALQVVHYYVAPKLGTALPQVASYPTDRLHKYLRDMERGGIFKQLGINNFLEGDFFGWYLEIWDDALDRGIRRVISELANFSLFTLDADPDQTRDLLKKLYQNVMPKQLRHDLGEYYTPDWLAERLLNQLGFSSDRDPKLHEKRLLDPACGSGTFLVLAIKRVKDHCADKPIKQAEVLRRVLSNIVGFDLNPLAVITARTNYLLALGDLLSVPRDFDVNLPVYTCDSILTPSQAEERVGPQLRMMGPEERLYRFRTVVGEFAMPGSLVSAQYVDALAGLVEECVDDKYSLGDFRKRLLQTFPLVDGKDELDIQVLEQLYTRIKELDEKAINGIWARIIKNAFAPLFCGQFDYVAGNPPWVNWENLPDEYAASTAALWNTYKLFQPMESQRRLRSERTKVDLSVLMMCTSMNNYLKRASSLGFVITQSIFKSEAGRGFRRLELPDGSKFTIYHVDDMNELHPFEGATNLTSVVVSRKGAATRYPVPYTYWRKAEKRTALPVDMALEDVISKTYRSRWVAQPINLSDSGSPWITGRPRAIGSIHKCIGQSPYADMVREGTNTRGANGIYWIDLLHVRPDGNYLIGNKPQAGKKQGIDSKQAAVEPDLVFPHLRGEDVHQWSAAPSGHILLPYDESTGRLIPEEELKTALPKTYRFLKEFEQALRARNKFRNFNPKEGVFYEMYNVGPYSFAPFKLVWRYIATGMICASVSTSLLPDGSEKPIVPDCKLMTVPLASREEAHFVCAFLGSGIAQFIVRSYSVGTQISTHVLSYVRLPKFNPKDKVHQELAALSEQAHQAAADGDKETIASIEKRIDALAAEMWGLTKAELKEIQESLADLRS